MVLSISLLVWNDFRMSFNKAVSHGIILHFIQINWNLLENKHKISYFLILLWPWMNFKVITTGVKL